VAPLQPLPGEQSARELGNALERARPDVSPPSLTNTKRHPVRGAASYVPARCLPLAGKEAEAGMLQPLPANDTVAMVQVVRDVRAALAALATIHDPLRREY